MMGNGTEFAQVGWAKEYNWSSAYVYYFWESNATNGPQKIELVPNPGSGGGDTYTVYTNGSGHTLFIINGTGYANQTLNFSPTRVYYAGETHYEQDQFPGDTNYHVEFDAPEYLYNGSWNLFDPQGSNELNAGKYSWISSSYPGNDYFYVWDNRYSSQY